ncbi:MAG TPA: hypothetical protein VKH19_09990 [Gemmatimonadaceae bacterium]|nr:hypothetical protein [Gemmatimonadaceae bacterium]
MILKSAEIGSVQSRRSKLFLVIACVSAVMSAPPRAQAQSGLWAGDSLLALGRLASAESAYYAAARARPRDPLVRAALGRFLAARGATRVGTVLLEEARQFGGDSAVIARALVPMYARLGDFAAIDTLRPAVLSAVERRRARWLREHPPLANFRDSIVVLSYRPTADGEGVGTILVRFGRAQVTALIDPRVSGLLVPRTMASDVRTFGEKAGTAIFGVADAVRIGGIVFSSVPATIDIPDSKLRLGFDVLASYSPTFDPRRGLVTLRKPERRSRLQPGARVPTLFDANGVRLLVGDRWQPSTAAMPAMLLATRQWMWDGRRGDIVFLTP